MANNTRKTVYVDLTHRDYSSETDTLKQLVHTYGGKVSHQGSGSYYVVGQIPRERLSHLKSTATKKGISVYTF